MWRYLMDVDWVRAHQVFSFCRTVFSVSFHRVMPGVLKIIQMKELWKEVQYKQVSRCCSSEDLVLFPESCYIRRWWPLQCSEIENSVGELWEVFLADAPQDNLTSCKWEQPPSLTVYPRAKYDLPQQIH